jgi:hypothetical protein
MSTKKVSRASNVAGQALESRGSSLHCSSSIGKTQHQAVDGENRDDEDVDVEVSDLR